ncbi:MAG: N-acetylmuramoyl-L-alanine amidase [Hydrogenophaga sp.]|uniref:N-acetylmuramoyl-L-alanine amidase n=1 Tax=Hydrogenophaga sp. TaxID=1904254 RepID=UPI001D5440EB|nr:N-acetylmuramoyl-L-alanine amidase [Hydrogenophaga sp.]MBX3609840.1 N-acetylmuramoyl-L-alanine amidase [Hydrogenophaga sp.]
MLRIEQHRLVGPGVSQQATPNTGGALRPRYLVLHYTAGRDAESAVRSLCTRKPQGNASAHLVLGRDGQIVQLAPFDVTTWHAGVSQWGNLIGLNSSSIGIEMDNAGLLHHEGERCVAWFGRAYPRDEVVVAEHKHGGGTQPWHAYSEVQIERALALCELLVAHYGLEDVLGHEDIARGRKVDPGPAFPLGAVRSRALGRGSDAVPRMVVTVASLNIRDGPGAEFAKLAPALKRGTELIVLRALDRWSQVAVVGSSDLEGWVCNDFIERQVARRGETAPLARTQRQAPVAARRTRPTTKSARTRTRAASARQR